MSTRGGGEADQLLFPTSDQGPSKIDRDLRRRLNKLAIDNHIGNIIWTAFLVKGIFLKMDVHIMNDRAFLQLYM